MAFNLLATVGSALVSKMLNPQQQQAPAYTPLPRRPKVPLVIPPENWALRGVNPADVRLMDNPIIQAYSQSPTAPVPGGPEAAPEEKKPATGPSLKDTFLQSLVQGLGQRMFAGNQQPQHTYTPPTFRYR